MRNEKISNETMPYLWLLDYYAQNRESVKSMTDKEYTKYLDEILDELNRIKKLLDESEPS